MIDAVDHELEGAQNKQPIGWIKAGRAQWLLPSLIAVNSWSVDGDGWRVEDGWIGGFTRTDFPKWNCHIGMRSRRRHWTIYYNYLNYIRQFNWAPSLFPGQLHPLRRNDIILVWKKNRNCSSRCSSCAASAAGAAPLMSARRVIYIRFIYAPGASFSHCNRRAAFCTRRGVVAVGLRLNAIYLI